MQNPSEAIASTEEIPANDIPETRAEITPQETAPAQEPAPAAAPVRQAPPPFDPRRRLRELLSIPEYDRSDAVWDEINELEIQLAPGNRVFPAGGNPGSGSNAPGNPGSKPFNPHKKHRPNPNKGGGGGGGGGEQRDRRPPGNNPQRPPKKGPPRTPNSQ